jgi:polyribonucleotide nucleotidyltransferase
MAIEIPFENSVEIYKLNEIAKQSNGSAWVQEGDSILLATVTVDELNNSEDDFLPLTVQYIEKSYSVGKIPGGYIKREGKPSDFETLTSRIVDRALRPLFPKGFNYPVQITIYVLSVDEDADLQTLALKAGSSALYVSDLPVSKSISAVRIGRVNNKFIVNPKAKDKNESTLDLFVAGSKNELLMIEMRSIGKTTGEIRDENALPESDLIEALNLASEKLSEINSIYENKFDEIAKQPLDLPLVEKELPKELELFIKENFDETIKESLTHLAKSERAMILVNISRQILTRDDISEEWNEKIILESLQNRKREIMRDMVLKDKIRADGRGLKDVRPITIETNVLPKVHGSCLFTRGQTQALVTLTVGTTEDSQMFEELSEGIAPQFESFMVHYNFPGFSVGEASRIRGVGRRELGHGNLAKRALDASLKAQDGFSIRLVSEILESNGSSSMATVCGGSLALRSGGQPISSLIAGVAMGMITEDEEYSILTDIMGLEYHDGDMDFKVAGPREGITALQMDIKLGGISPKVLAEALNQAKEARSHILGIMEEAESKIVVNREILPKVESFKISPKKVVDVLGQGGKTIKSLVENFDVKIDIDRDSGGIRVIGRKSQNVQDATNEIKRIADDRKPSEIYSQGMQFSGTVKSITKFGAFIDLPLGGDGLLHISKISKQRIENIEDFLSVGEELKIEIVAVKGHKIELKRVGL